MSKTIWAMYFSGTGTTETMTTHIAKRLTEKINESLESKTGSGSEDKAGADPEGKTVAKMMAFDFTKPAARKEPAVFGEDDIVILGTPVIAGRTPNLLLKYLDTIRGNGALGVPVVMYGCRAFDDSLVELRNIMGKDGFRTFAGAACAAEHSMSTILGAGRPDAFDLKDADKFADRVFDKLVAYENGSLKETEFIPIAVDGNDPPGPYYIPRDKDGGPIDIRKVKPVTNENCDNCGKCAELCPLGSISFEDYSKVEGICMKCCACIKKCPQGAKYFDDRELIYHKTDLENLFGNRRADNYWFV